MRLEYKILESPNKNGTLTIKIEDEQLSFNHTLIHENEEYEEFYLDDFGVQIINSHKVYHINGHIITFKEYRFVQRVIEDL